MKQSRVHPYIVQPIHVLCKLQAVDVTFAGEMNTQRTAAAEPNQVLRDVVLQWTRTAAGMEVRATVSHATFKPRSAPQVIQHA
jgi:hypothetical protein